MYPITYDDVLAARTRLRPYLDPSPVRHYPPLDELVGHGIRVLVKHENHLPTGSFKVRNGTSSIMALTDDEAEAVLDDAGYCVRLLRMRKRTRLVDCSTGSPTVIR